MKHGPLLHPLPLKLSWIQMVISNQTRPTWKSHNTKLGLYLMTSINTKAQTLLTHLVLQSNPLSYVLFSLAASNKWVLRQLDINNVFLQGTLQDDVYTIQLPGFVDPYHPFYICKLMKALYGIKQAKRAWYTVLKSHLLTMGFRNAILIEIIIYLLVYVDDIILIRNTTFALNKFIVTLANRFSLQDLGILSYFLWVEVHNQPKGLLLRQKRYIIELLNKANMEECNSIATSLPTNPTLRLQGKPLDNPTITL